MSKKILTALASEDIPALSQALLVRGNHIASLQAMGLQTLSTADAAAYQTCMDEITQREPDVQAGIQRLGKQYGEQLKQVNQQKVGIRQYKQGHSAHSTRSDQA